MPFIVITDEVIDKVVDELGDSAAPRQVASAIVAMYFYHISERAADSGMRLNSDLAAKMAVEAMNYVSKAVERWINNLPDDSKDIERARKTAQEYMQREAELLVETVRAIAQDN